MTAAVVCWALHSVHTNTVGPISTYTRIVSSKAMIREQASTPRSLNLCNHRLYLLLLIIKRVRLLDLGDRIYAHLQMLAAIFPCKSGHKIHW